MTQEFRRLMRLEIADGRSGKKSDPRPQCGGLWNREGLGEIGDQRIYSEMPEIAPQQRRVLLQEVAGNVDRNIGFHRRRGAEQDARLLARA